MTKKPSTTEEPEKLNLIAPLTVKKKKKKKGSNEGVRDVAEGLFWSLIDDGG